MELTDRQIDMMRAEAQALNLSGADLITNNSDELIRSVCNGIGPSSFSDKTRNFLNKYFPHLVLPAMIHDLRYYYGVGTCDDFQAANAEFAFNAERVAWHSIEWWRILRKFCVIWTGARFATICDKFGWHDYIAAINKRIAREEARFAFSGARDTDTVCEAREDNDLIGVQMGQDTHPGQDVDSAASRTQCSTRARDARGRFVKQS